MELEFRTIFLSDLHLGMRGCQARMVANFLQHVRCEKLYLVGDILDMWWLQQRWHWPEDHSEVIGRILGFIAQGTEVIFVPGNHDRAARQYLHMEFAGVKVRPFDVHHTADGRRLLIVHGDEYDLTPSHSHRLSKIGGHAYGWLVRINHHFNRLRRLMGLRYWSLSHYVKLKVKRACMFIQGFEEALIQEARRRELDGVVCGHVHKAEHLVKDGVEYFNCGDWLESCTALVEHPSGRMEIIEGADFLEQIARSEQPNTSAAPSLASTGSALLHTEPESDMPMNA